VEKDCNNEKQVDSIVNAVGRWKGMGQFVLAVVDATLTIHNKRKEEVVATTSWIQKGTHEVVEHVERQLWYCDGIVADGLM
jgi:hypothetical protein